MKMLVLFALAGVPLMHGSTSKVDSKKEFRFHYFDMYAQTYEEINIDEAYDLTSVVRPDRDKILSILGRHDLPSTRFMPSQTRIKMELEEGRVILMDVAGEVKDGDSIYRLNNASRKQLFEEIKGTLPDDMLSGR